MSLPCVISPIKCCEAISNILTFDPLFYYSGDPEFINLFGPSIVLNTKKCDGFIFSYSENLIAKKISDNTNVLITNFLKTVNGVTTSGDYLSL